MAEVFTIGETMVSFTPLEAIPLRYATNYRQRIAGAESNVAIGLQKLGHETAWMSKLGDDELGQYIFNSVRSEGVDMNSVLFDEQNATGVMFKEITAGETKVSYYRQFSAASFMEPDELSVEQLKKAKIFHFTGITSVLSSSCRELIDKAIDLAKQYHVKISFDPNIRKKLWKDEDYTEIIRNYCMISDIVLLGLEEARILFGTSEVSEIFRAIFEAGKAESVAIKDGGNGAWVFGKEEQNYHFISPYPCNCVDTVGAGDAFNAGFLAGILEGRAIKESGQMGAIAGALATEIRGDIEGYPDRKRMQAILEKKFEICR